MTKTKKSRPVRYWLLTMHVRNGAYEYTDRHVTTASKDDDISAYAQEYAKTFYDGEAEAYCDGFLHCGGTVYVEAQLCHRLTKAEFNVLQRFL